MAEPWKVGPRWRQVAWAEGGGRITGLVGGKSHLK